MVSKYVDGRDTYLNVKDELTDIITDLGSEKNRQGS